MLYVSEVMVTWAEGLGVHEAEFKQDHSVRRYSGLTVLVYKVPGCVP